MSDRLEASAPPQEKGADTQTPEFSEYISIINETVWQGRELTAERQLALEEDFKQSFGKLSEKEQRSILLELQSLGIEIDAISTQNDGIAIIRQTEMTTRAQSLMERTGVITSATEGGLTLARETLSNNATRASEYLHDYETFARSVQVARSVQDGSEDINYDVKYVLAIISGIRQELERLQLGNATTSSSNGELQAERESRSPMNTSIRQFGKQLNSTIETEGLIGFSTLDKLIKEFHSAKASLEESILLSQMKE